MVGIRGESIDLLKKYAAELKAEIYRIPGIVDMDVTMEQDIPEFRLRVDRERAVDSGVTTLGVVRTVGALVGGQAVSTYEDEDGDAVDVRVRLPLDLRQDPTQVEQLRISVRKPPAPTTLVSLGGLLNYEMSNSPSAIDRQDLTRQVVISANLDGLALGTAQRRIQEATKKLQMLPGYRVVFFGEAQEMAESFGYMVQALILAIILVYLILAAQFESFVDPLSIMLSLPLSVVGMAAMLTLTRDPLSMVSFIGLIMLMGLVTKNAILLVDYAKTLRRRGNGPQRGAHYVGADQAASDHDDHPRHDFRDAAPCPGPWCGGRDAGAYGPSRHRRSHHVDGPDAGGRARGVQHARRSCRMGSSPPDGKREGVVHIVDFLVREAGSKILQVGSCEKEDRSQARRRLSRMKKCHTNRRSAGDNPMLPSSSAWRRWSRAPGSPRIR